MCWCTPSIRTPHCGKIDCVPPQETRKPCDHKFVFMRQEQRPADHSWRPETQKIDVFFCEKCCEYKEIIAAESMTFGDGRKIWVPRKATS